MTILVDTASGRKKQLCLSDPLTALSGVGPKKAERLTHLGLRTIGDLLAYAPFRYQNRKNPILLRQAPDGKDVFLAGTVVSKKKDAYAPGRKRRFRVFLTDDDGAFFQVCYFNAGYLDNIFVIGTRYYFFGRFKTDAKRYRTMYHPHFFRQENAEFGIFPVYHKTEGISDEFLIGLVKQALSMIDPSYDWLPDELIQGNEQRKPMLNLYESYRNLHFPEDEKHYGWACYRLRYDRIFAYECALLAAKKEREAAGTNGAVEPVSLEPFFASLPFELTEGKESQKSAVLEIAEDLASPVPMNRLIQGDVGCGKTAVAEAAIYLTVKAGHQAAFMAPTDLLARQHASSLAKAFQPFGFRIGLLVSSMKKKAKEELLTALEQGEMDVVVGTHALLQEDVLFHDLALVVTDEQHRFGVNQRRILTEKATRPNVLVMSATPIPRTLAATVYGDMDYSVITAMPANRFPIATQAGGRESRNRYYQMVREELMKGHRAYAVAPTIDGEDEDGFGLTAVEKLYEELKGKFRDFSVGLLHGQMKKDEKEATMRRFATGEIQLLVATVVIEVGIDIPEATVIVIENAERFGLAQLHQLRGRVGRSDRPSYCLLLSYSSGQQSKERMQAMVELRDGFAVSERDLLLRGSGDLTGTLQHGALPSIIEDQLRDPLITETARDDAEQLMNGAFRAYDEGELLRRMDRLGETDYSHVI